MCYWSCLSCQDKWAGTPGTPLLHYSTTPLHYRVANISRTVSAVTRENLSHSTDKRVSGGSKTAVLLPVTLYTIIPYVTIHFTMYSSSSSYPVNAPFLFPVGGWGQVGRGWPAVENTCNYRGWALALMSYQLTCKSVINDHSDFTNFQ